MEHYKSTPLCIEESLLAVGGKRSDTRKDVSTLLLHTPHSDKWTEGGQLPIVSSYSGGSRRIQEVIHKFNLTIQSMTLFFLFFFF